MKILLALTQLAALAVVLLDLFVWRPL